jgi:hypothetical protein
VRGRHEGIPEGVVLVAELNDGMTEFGSLLHPQPLCHAPGDAVAHHHLQGDDLNPPTELPPLVEASHEVGRDPCGGNCRQEKRTQFVVEFSLAGKLLVLHAVEGGRVVLVGKYDEIGIGGRKDSFRLSLVQLIALFHGSSCGAVGAAGAFASRNTTTRKRRLLPGPADQARWGVLLPVVGAFRRSGRDSRTDYRGYTGRGRDHAHPFVGSLYTVGGHRTR